MSFSSLHIDDQRTWGGGQSQVLHLLKGLSRGSHQAELVTFPGSPLGQRAEESGIKVHPVRMRGETDIFSARRISKIIKGGGFDIVHMHTGHAHMLGAMACAFNSSPVCIVSKRVAFPIRTGPMGMGKLKYLWRIDAYIAVCDAIRKLLVGVGVDAAKVHVVYSGVVPPRIEDGSAVREELGVGPDEKLVGNVGALVDAKGQQYLVEAIPLILKKAPKAKFVIVGSGRLESNLRNCASRLGVSESIFFPGFREDVAKFLAAFDLFVAPSCMEGLNNSIIEAMMVGKPVVASDVGGIPEIVEDGKTGTLVPAGDPAALAEAVVDVLNNPETAARLASAGRETALREFTTDRMINGTISVYEQLLREKCKT